MITEIVLFRLPAGMTREDAGSRIGAVAWAVWHRSVSHPLIEPDVPISGIRLVWGFSCQVVQVIFFCCPSSDLLT